VKSTTKAQHGLYEYDAVARLRDGQLGDERVKNIANYIKPGKLWDAFVADDTRPVEDAWFIDANLPDACIDGLTARAHGQTLVAASTVSTPKAARLAGDRLILSPG